MTSMGIWIALAATGLSTIFSALYLSIRGLSRGRLEEMVVERGGAGLRRRIDRILDDEDGHAAATALPRTISNLVVVIALVHWVTHLTFDGAADAIGFPTWTDTLIGLGASALLLWVFGTVVPLGISKHAPEAMVCTWSWLIRTIYVVAGPLRGVVTFVDEVVRRLAGVREQDEGEAIAQELMSVVQEAAEEGQFDEVERRMIEAVLQFKSKTVEQIMTPRTEMRALELTNNLGEIVAFVRKSGHSRIPVFEADLDHIVGIFYVKDLLRWLAGEGTRSGKPFELRTILRPALFVPETKTVRELLEELREKKVHLAMVADEYGGTSGLVTFEDVIEEVFGDVQDEYEPAEETVPDVVVDAKTRSAEIDARAYIREVNEALAEIGASLPEGEEYDTAAGFVITMLGHIPVAGEQLRHDGLVLTVLEAEPTRVVRIKLEVKEPEEPVVQVVKEREPVEE